MNVTQKIDHRRNLSHKLETSCIFLLSDDLSTCVHVNKWANVAGAAILEVIRPHDICYLSI